jgi:hypothetical protein
MGRGVICRQPRLRGGHRQGRGLHLQTIRFVLSSPTFLRVLPFIGDKDVLSVFDERDPTAARPTTREKARELCSEHMTEWSSSGSGDLTNLRIGIPQVRPQ